MNCCASLAFCIQTACKNLWPSKTTLATIKEDLLQEQLRAVDALSKISNQMAQQWNLDTNVRLLCILFLYVVLTAAGLAGA